MVHFKLVYNKVEENLIDISIIADLYYVWEHTEVNEEPHVNR